MVGHLTWAGWKIGGADADFILGEVEGFGHGAHRNSSAEREGGGALGGRIVPGSRTFSADAWALDEGDLLKLRGAMAAVPDPSGVAPLAWKGIGWGTLEVASWVRPVGFDQAGDDGADGLASAVSPDDRPAIGLRCSWFAEDPTVYSAAETSFSSETPAAARSITWTNPGTLDPLPGLGGRQWWLAITAATTVLAPFVEVDGLRVRWAGLTLSPGQTLRVDHNRHSWVGSVPVDGFLRQGAGSSVDVLWPTFPPQREATMLIGNSSGTFTYEAGVRGTW